MRAERVADDAGFLLARGARVVLVTVNAAAWDGMLAEGVEIVELREGEGRHPLPRGERALLFVLPGAVLRVLGRLLPARAAVAVTALHGAWDRVARTLHERLFLRGYGVLRPLLLSRVARREVLPRVDLDQVDQVVVVDVPAVPFGWRLARRRPGLDVRFLLDRSRWEERDGSWASSTAR